MSDFSWHKGEPPKDGRQYLVAYRSYPHFDVVQWWKSMVENFSCWIDASYQKTVAGNAWAELPPVDWDALEEE